MLTLEFNIEINDPKEKVWDILWNEATYKQWTSVFCEGNYVVSDWKEGSKIQFLSPSGDGMNSIIDKKISNEYIAFKHISEIKNFVEIPFDSRAQEWSGTMETYQLTQKNGVTILEAKMDLIEKYKDYFKATFPKGLDLVKKLSEEK